MADVGKILRVSIQLMERSNKTQTKRSPRPSHFGDLKHQKDTFAQVRR
jgi:hypothetical protein